MLDKGYGYQNISSKKSNANTMYLIDQLKIHYWLSTQTLRIIKQN